MKNIKYQAVYLPDDKRHCFKKRFNSENEAYDYIIKYICDSCKRDFSNDQIRSFCAYEWIVQKYEEK